MELFTVENLANLGVLLFLQAVLGFDNLLYISIESKRVPKDMQEKVRRNSILIAMAMRIVLLFAMIKLIETFSAPLFDLDMPGFIEGSFNFSVVVFLFGGAFIMYTAVKEISHMLAIDDLNADVEKKSSRTPRQVISMIVLMNLIFSFDSILSALAITEVFPILAIAIIGSSLSMLFMADHVSEFLARNRKYEVLGLFILLIVGIVLLGEGGHIAHLKLFGYGIEPLSKSTFYFSIGVLVFVDIIQSKYQKKLSVERKQQAAAAVTEGR
ncbi:MAG: TerC family protein [Nannocystaceae bacterium]